MDGSLAIAAGRAGVAEATNPGDELQRKTLPKEPHIEEVVLGMEAILSEFERSVSTAALTRYAIAIKQTWCQ